MFFFVFLNALVLTFHTFLQSCVLYFSVVRHSDRDMLNPSLIYNRWAVFSFFHLSRKCHHAFGDIDGITSACLCQDAIPRLFFHLFLPSVYHHLHLSPLGGLRARLHSSSSVPNFLKFPFLATVRENDCPDPKNRYTHTRTKSQCKCLLVIAKS